MTPLSIISPILRLSTKYQIQSLREQAISQLTTAFPDTLQGYLSRSRTALVVEDVERPNTELISLARETCAMHLLPAAFHWAATIGMYMDSETCEDFWEGAKCSGTDKLSNEDLTKMSFGREQLRRAVYRQIGSFLYEPSPSACCRGTCDRLKKETLSADWWIGFTESAEPFSPHLKTELGKSLAGLCPLCKDVMWLSVEAGRRKVWDDLPSYFALPDWETLRALTVRGYCDSF